jgi:hypothetical protein
MSQDDKQIKKVVPLCSIILDEKGKVIFDKLIVKTYKPPCSILILPSEIDWIFFKQKNASLLNVEIIDLHIGLFSSGQMAMLKSFARLNLEVGYAYTIKDILDWLKIMLGPTKELYEAMNLLPPPNFNRVKQLDIDLDRCLDLLDFWQRDNITQTHNDLQANIDNTES